MKNLKQDADVIMRRHMTEGASSLTAVVTMVRLAQATLHDFQIVKQSLAANFVDPHVLDTAHETLALEYLDWAHKTWDIT